MLGLMGFSGSLPLYVIHRYYIFVFIDRANKDACLLACLQDSTGQLQDSTGHHCTPQDTAGNQMSNIKVSFTE